MPEEVVLSWVACSAFHIELEDCLSVRRSAPTFKGRLKPMMDSHDCLARQNAVLVRRVMLTCRCLWGDREAKNAWI